MRIALADHSAILGSLVPNFRAKQLSYRDVSFPERTMVHAVDTNGPVDDLRDCEASFLFNYEIFPSTIMRFAAEWRLEHRTMRPGDVIVQQVFLPPGPLSIKCIFAVRVLEVIRTPQKVGFQYGTLEGHVETGVSEFALTSAGAQLQLIIRTFSRPASVLGRLTAPLFALPYQQYCTRRALDQMTVAFIRANPDVTRARDDGLTSARSRRGV